MAEITPWFQRSFPFPVSVELLPEVASRLRGAPDRLQAKVQRLDPELVKRKVQGKWSIQEHVGHLLDIEPLWIARVEDYGSRATELTPTDLQNTKTDAANHNATSLPSLLQGYRDSRKRLLEAIGKANVSGAVCLPHPRLRTPMSLVDHLYFVAEHDDHHLAVIDALATM